MDHDYAARDRNVEIEETKDILMSTTAPIEDLGLDPELVEAIKGNAIIEPNHYAKYPIEPITFIIKNGIPFVEGNVIKYVMRWRDKNGVADLKKARRYLDMLINHEEGKETL